jgi:hypothetical protein
LTWAIIVGLYLLEEMQNMLRAVRRPNRQQMVISVRERAAAPHGDQPRVFDFAENHGLFPLPMGNIYHLI